MPGMPALGTGDTVVNKPSNNPCPDTQVGERRRQREATDKISEINGMLSEYLVPWRKNKARKGAGKAGAFSDVYVCVFSFKSSGWGRSHGEGSF